MKYTDYYATLGVDRDASDEEIKKTYRRLARQYHPDISKEAVAEERFKEVNEAYQTLSDPEKRRAYDQLGRHAPGEEFSPPPDWDSRYWQGQAAEEIDLADLFARMGFQSGRPGGGTGASFSLRGQDYDVAASLSLEEAARGTEVALDLAMPQLRPDGRVERVSRTLRIRVPKGVTEGERLRIPGKGGAGIGNGPPGDLYLDLHLRPHPLFRVVDHDLYLEVPIAPWEAALGGEITVPTLDGRLVVSVPAGARTGQKLRLAGKGLPRRRQGAGDLYGVLQIVNPPSIGERERELYRQLADASDFQPRNHFPGERP